MMTKKDYVKIVKIIKLHSRIDNGVFEKDKGRFIEDLIECFKQDNPRFDENKFREACKYRKDLKK